MDKEKFQSWCKKEMEKIAIKRKIINSLENIPIIKIKKYFNELDNLNRKYVKIYGLGNEYFGIQESIDYYYMHGQKETASEGELELKNLMEEIGEIQKDYILENERMDFLTYNFDIADHMNKIGIIFPKTFYFDISRE